MTIRYIHDHEEAGIEQLLSQFDDSPMLRGFAGVLLLQVQELENTLLDLFLSRTLQGSSGEQLDVIGRVVGEAREGLGDGEYRRFLQVRIAVNFSQGERERLTDIIALATGASDVHYQAAYPAGFRITYTVSNAFSAALQARIKGIMEDATGSGIAFTIVEADDEYFGFEEDDDALGFDDGIMSQII